jgi:hypothetical protein
MQLVSTDTLTIPTVSALSVAAIQYLKKSSWFPWLSDESSNFALRLASVFTALGSAVGIHFVYSASEGTLMVSGLTMAAILPAGWAWLKQLVWNELVFQTAVKAPGNAAVAAKATPAGQVQVAAQAAVDQGAIPPAKAIN